jgi:hypothetical protein
VTNFGTRPDPGRMGCESIVAAVRRDCRPRRQRYAGVASWLRGRMHSFLQAALDWLVNETTREATVAVIVRRYPEFVRISEKAGTT